MAAPGRDLVGSPPPSVASLLKRVSLHGVTADIVGPAILRRTADLVLAGYPDADPLTETDFEVRAIRVKGQPKTWQICCGDRVHPAGPGVGMGSLWIEWLLTSEYVRRWTNFVHVHAGVVSNGERSALLIGRSGSGKSTTSVAMALEGYVLYSDDVALVDPDTLRPLCVPRPVKLDPIARRSLRSRGLRLDKGTWIGESINRTCVPGLPDVDRPGPPIEFAIFFGDSRQSRAELRPITSAEAAMRLIMQSSSEKFDHSGPSDGAMTVVNGAKNFELTAGDLDATVRELRQLLDSGVWSEKKYRSNAKETGR